MNLSEAIYGLELLKNSMESKLKLIGFGTPLKLTYLKEAKSEYLATIDKLRGLTLETENTKLNELKKDLSVLYLKVCSLLEEAIKAVVEVEEHDTTSQQVVLRQEQPQALPAAVLSSVSALPMDLSIPFLLGVSSLKKASNTDVIVAYAKKLIDHGRIEEVGFGFGFGSFFYPLEKFPHYDFSKYYSFRSNVIPRLFDINRHHASPLGKHGGLWFDPYGREGVIPDYGAETSLTHITCISPVDGDDSVLKYIYSYDMQSVIEEYKHKYDFFSKLKFEGPIDIDGNLFGFVTVPINFEIPDFLHFLGGLGALPSRDTMLYLYTRQFLSLSNSIASFSKRMSFRLQYDVDFDGAFQDDSDMKVLESKKGLYYLITELEQYLENSSLEMYKYYYEVTLNLVKGIKEIYGQEGPHVILAVDRISDLILRSKSSDYSEFIECISLIWDELRWLSKPMVEVSQFLTVSYPIKQKLYEETISSIKKYSEHISDYPPAHATLGSSGMNVLVQSIHNALKELTSEGKIAALRYGKNNYFEIGHFLGHYLLGCRISTGTEATIYTDGDEAIIKPSDWPDGLVTLYIDIPFANVQLEIAGYKYTHVNDFIEEQLKLREQLDNPPPLICILDTTVGYSNDVFIKWTLTQFHDALEKGKLYIFFAHSLNKSWTMGLDKGCAGFCHQYGNLDYFPHLKDKILQDATQLNLGGLSLTGSTVSFIKLIMSSCPDLIDSYSEYIHSNSRFVHQSILKSLIGSKQNYIVIDDPESYPSLKDSSKPLMELVDVSTFVTIRLNEKYHLDKNIGFFFNSLAIKLLDDIGIRGRDGYGFAETIYTVITNIGGIPIIRISIGSESPEVLAKRFNRLKDFIVKSNQVIGNYFPLIYGQEECKDPDIILIALRELFEIYVSVYPKDKNLPIIREKAEEIFQQFAAGYIEASREKKAGQSSRFFSYDRTVINEVKELPTLEESPKPGPTK